MSVRSIVLAFPLVLGVACGTPGAPRGAASRVGGPSERGETATVPGHARDRVLTGNVSEVTNDSVSIRAPAGGSKTLRIVPQTKVTVNGKVAPLTHILPGQQVRASYAEHDGEAIAVRIDAGDAPEGGATFGPML